VCAGGRRGTGGRGKAPGFCPRLQFVQGGDTESLDGGRVPLLVLARLKHVHAGLKVELLLMDLPQLDCLVVGRQQKVRRLKGGSISRGEW